MTVRFTSASSRSSGSRPVERFFEFSLLGLLASGYLAVVGSGFLDLPTIVLTGAGLLLRALMVAGIVRLEFSPRAVAALTLGYIGFYPLDYFYFSKQFLPATVHLVFFLAITKVLTAKTNRDYTYVKVIAFLELLAACLLSARFNFFLFLALFLFFSVATFASAEVRRSAQKPLTVVRSGLRFFHWRLALLTIFVSFGILSMTAGLFFLLPRTARAAFQHLVSQRYRLPGFSNEVVLGEIGEIKQQSTPVMHVRMYGNDPPRNLKWRGAALTEFDGRRWFNPPGSSEVLRADHGLFRRIHVAGQTKVAGVARGAAGCDPATRRLGQCAVATRRAEFGAAVRRRCIDRRDIRTGQADGLGERHMTRRARTIGCREVCGLEPVAREAALHDRRLHRHPGRSGDAVTIHAPGERFPAGRIPARR